MLAFIVSDDPVESGDIPTSADLLISLGDFSERELLGMSKSLANPPTLAIKGNHDPGYAFLPPIRDMHLITFAFNGLTFGGLQGCWAYKVGKYCYMQEEAIEMLQQLPAVDVLITHNSPAGIHERDNAVHQGFTAINEYISKYRPKFVLHGHQHMDRETKLGSTRIIGIYKSKLLELR